MGPRKKGHQAEAICREMFGGANFSLIRYSWSTVSDRVSTPSSLSFPSSHYIRVTKSLKERPLQRYISVPRRQCPAKCIVPSDDAQDALNVGNQARDKGLSVARQPGDGVLQSGQGVRERAGDGRTTCSIKSASCVAPRDGQWSYAPTPLR